MTIPYIKAVYRMPHTGNDFYYYFALSLPPEYINLSAIIIDAGTLKDLQALLLFIDDVLEGKNLKNEFWTNGYTAQVVEKDEKKMLKIFFRLTDDYPPCFVDVIEFKELLESWISERAEFDKNPIAYKEKLKKNGETKALNIFPG